MSSGGGRGPKRSDSETGPGARRAVASHSRVAKDGWAGRRDAARGRVGAGIGLQFGDVDPVRKGRTGSNALSQGQPASPYRVLGCTLIHEGWWSAAAVRGQRPLSPLYMASKPGSNGK